MSGKKSPPELQYKLKMAKVHYWITLIDIKYSFDNHKLIIFFSKQTSLCCWVLPSLEQRLRFDEKESFSHATGRHAELNHVSSSLSIPFLLVENGAIDPPLTRGSIHLLPLHYHIDSPNP